ncbi:MAG: S-methyl-5'-thioadenosine phosphorylase, partial [Actinobacteria bacterium]|nr:S-methyl-5'-thioadenosine phosphorylase [Actinomycetota bacterium]
MPKTIGLIAGTGFYDLPALKDAQSKEVETAYGIASVKSGQLSGVNLVFLTR